MQVEPVRLARRQMNEGPQSKRRESDRKGKYHPSCAREVTNEKSGSFKLFAKKLFLLKLFHLLCGGYLTKITPGDSWVFLSSAYPQPNNQFPVGQPADAGSFHLIGYPPWHVMLGLTDNTALMVLYSD